MAKVKIQGHASGTGVLTVTAPNTSTDRTITLPDSTGTLATTTGGVAQLDHSGTKKLEATSTGATLTGDLAINDAHPEITFTDSDDTSYSVAYHSAGGFLIDVDKGQDVANSYFRLSIDDTPRLRVTADGLLFNSDTAAANALNDYEEGNHSSSWTTGNSGSITMGRNSMGYVKVGKVVTITGEFDVGSVSSPIGGLRVSLPFTIASHTSERNMSFVTRAGMYHVPHSQDNPPLFIGHAGTSHIEGIYERDDASFTDYNPQAGETVWLCFSYFTDS